MWVKFLAKNIQPNFWNDSFPIWINVLTINSLAWHEISLVEFFQFNSVDC